MADGNERGISILHVDDDPEYGRLTAESLEREDDRFEVTTTTDPSAALDRVDEAVDCIVSDYEMPEMDGIELLEAVRAEYPDLPFVLFTGTGSEELASEAISANVTDYLGKGRNSAQFTVLANRIANAVDQYRSHRALARNQQRLSLFVEQSPLGVIEWDESYTVTSVNPAAEAILGYSEAELVGRSWETFVPDAHQDEVASLFDRLSKDEGGYHNINEIVTKDGDRRICEWHNRIVTDDEEVVAIYSQFQDVTERRTRREAVADLHQVATALTECDSREEIYRRTITAADTILEFDQAALAIESDGLLHVKAMSNDLPLDERPTMSVDQGIAGKTYRTGEPQLISDVVEADEADPQGEGMRAAISVPVGLHGVFQVIDDEPDAFDQYDLELAKLLVRHTENALDVLERERTLERLHDRVEFALEVTKTIIWTGDFESGELRTLMGSPKRFFGPRAGDRRISAEQFSQTVIHPEDRDAVERTYEQVSRGTTDEFRVEFRTHPELGSVRWILSVGFVQETDDGRMLVGTATDVTEQKQREAELQRQNERLEEFVHVVSHDLRNPLNVARGRLDLALENHATDHLEELDRALSRMETLVEDLLTLARDGAQVRETRSVDLASVCESCWRNVETVDATLSVTVDRTIEADRSRLQQLLENLFRNAVEHGGETVQVTVGSVPDGFYVEDDGPGIPESDREAVFDRGYSSSADGTGLGLRIVDRVAQAHDWEVNVTDGSTGGTRFEVVGVDAVAADDPTERPGASRDGGSSE
ncbi:hybrid sensor histidine kinase/response regulator [Halopiger goleimassiliensis]|uniref:hybrid sensor histidine kinase/response regulator n=1 Tax=Halopiger goleimassiliensis TaxID=1293048 RepID=UPI0006783241|nr:PAS domain S-box protein [Halopiger goleimassiliensis]